MTIDERNKYAEQKRDEAFSKDSLSGISYWDGYIAALEDSKDYRNATEVAKEIIKHLAKFVEDKEMLMSFYGKSGWFIKVDDVTDFIADINRMYEEGKG